MTVYNDVTQREKYNRLLFVEMLEYIARVAEANARDNPRLKRRPLDVKIIVVLDYLMPLVGMKRKDVVIEEVYIS